MLWRCPLHASNRTGRRVLVEYFERTYSESTSSRSQGARATACQSNDPGSNPPRLRQLLTEVSLLFLLQVLLQLLPSENSIEITSKR